MPERAPYPQRVGKQLNPAVVVVITRRTWHTHSVAPSSRSTRLVFVVLAAGDAYAVPRGVWHRLEPIETSYLGLVTPGPNGGHRPRNSAAR
jgi:hypothetical protein